MRLRNKPWTKDFLEKHDDSLIHFNKQNHLDLNKEFNNNNDVHLEIGCGKGQFITTLALKNSDINFIGMEKETTVVGVALKKSLNVFEQNKKQMHNLKYFNDFAEDLTEMFTDNSISKIYLNFSDPWPKKRHTKKRLTFITFLDRYSQILKKDGILEFKSDNDLLYEFSLEQLSQTNKWEIIYKTNDLYKDQEMIKDNIATEYETKFHSLGKNINKIIIKNLK
ncbi:tRNA (guanosine(46)-N7)-methyltransferase TrmB [Mycoplasma sp. HU2014]|uniref:tRNA (guanosine(46)-N7)-methyltransferase TrmB n=1 Tax=Mycoplasma sp. HU2014 TaxID=1664275 RepID=UPI00067CF6AB|nr:tRNA (guanosine(46)-N7)-methyltransferase TrmB [Mycoplasma sp. HU2014]KNG79817.1 tRNA (guanine-N(7)-)-methyltransferase [Mycoplasma sp. HU2014]